MTIPPPSAWRVFLGLAVTLSTLALLMIAWEVILTQVVDLQETRAKVKVLERRMSELEEKMDLVGQHLEAVAWALSLQLTPEP